MKEDEKSSAATKNTTTSSASESRRMDFARFFEVKNMTYFNDS